MNIPLRAPLNPCSRSIRIYACLLCALVAPTVNPELNGDQKHREFPNDQPQPPEVAVLILLRVCHRLLVSHWSIKSFTLVLGQEPVFRHPRRMVFVIFDFHQRLLTTSRRAGTFRPAAQSSHPPFQHRQRPPLSAQRPPIARGATPALRYTRLCASWKIPP